MISVHTTRIIQFDHLQDVEDKVGHLWFVFLVRPLAERSLDEREKGRERERTGYMCTWNNRNMKVYFLTAVTKVYILYFIDHFLEK